jgi:hypothetical protein
VDVHLTQGTTILASASATADAKGKWAAVMSIPSNLKPGTYAVTAQCAASPGGPAALSYNPQNFKVTTPACPVGPTTTTTVKCHVPPTTTTT